MKHIQASLVFKPNQKNPQRENGKGVWRVRFCFEVGNPLKTRVQYHSPHVLSQKYLCLMVTREYKVGSRVDPVKLALAYLRESRAAAELSKAWRDISAGAYRIAA